jgi:hypothetical protein
MSVPNRRQLIDRKPAALSFRRQCALLGIARALASTEHPRQVVELHIVERASDNTIGRTLKKTFSSRIASSNG